VLAPGQGELDLHLPLVVEVEAQGNQGEAAFPDPPLEARDLAPVGEQLTRALGLGVGAGGRLVGADVELFEKELAAADDRVGVTQVGPPRAQGLDLGANQHDPTLELVEHFVLEVSLAIGRNDGLGMRLRHGRGSLAACSRR